MTSTKKQLFIAQKVLVKLLVKLPTKSQIDIILTEAEKLPIIMSKNRFVAVSKVQPPDLDVPVR